MRVRDRARRDLGDRLALEPHRQSLGLEALAAARWAGLRVAVELRPVGFFADLLFLELVELDARAEAGGAPAVARVVREQARIERLEAAAAGRARSLGREELASRGTGRQHAHHVAAELDRARESVGEL